MTIAACASLLGLVAARLGGPHLPQILWSRPWPSDPGGLAETGLVRDGGSVPDPGAEVTAAETIPDLPPGAGTTPSARRAGHASARERLADELKSGVRKLGKRRYAIRRGALELALRNLRSLSSWVRVAPEVRAGRASGFRVVSITPGGPFSELGLRRDDVLVSVNGLDIRTPDHALDTYGKLKSASRFAVGLLREGRLMEQEYSIR